jgi:hypothetical protein
VGIGEGRLAWNVVSRSAGRNVIRCMRILGVWSFMLDARKVIIGLVREREELSWGMGLSHKHEGEERKRVPCEVLDDGWRSEQRNHDHMSSRVMNYRRDYNGQDHSSTMQSAINEKPTLDQ